MHFFPTTLANFECSSINSESQSRPLAVKSSSSIKTKHLRKIICQNAPRESVTNRKAQTAATKLTRVPDSVLGMREILLENVRTLRGATVPFGHEIDEKQESMQ